MNNFAYFFFSKFPKFAKSQQEDSVNFLFKSANENNFLGKVRLSWVLTEAAETREGSQSINNVILLTVLLFVGICSIVHRVIAICSKLTRKCN